MKKQWILALCLVLCAALLCGCSSGNESEPERYQVLNQATQSSVTVTQAPAAVVQETETEPVETSEPDWDNGSYDPSSEEGGDAEPVEEVVTASVVTAAPTVNSAYAGASPVVIDPIDKPTATPVPNLSITAYATYDALELGLSFDGPAGWETSTGIDGSFTITNPDTTVDAQAFLTISVQSVSSKYSTSQMTTAVKSVISGLKNSDDYKSVSSTNTADRTLLDAAGVYADYTATLSNGAKVYGRVQVACVNTKVYTVHCEYPYAYKDTYKTSLYNKMRSTIKITK